MLNDSRSNPVPAPAAAPFAERLFGPLQRFAEREASGGIVLLVCTVIAIAWANSPWAASYHSLWQQTVAVGIGSYAGRITVHHLVNDGLMAIFFFVVGLEIKREMLVGELASLRQAALPVAAALGGMLVPAAIFAMWNAGGPGAAGWGIPMATDIAFALGVLALLGNRIPASLTVFLAALAIADDIGAVLVIAIFYAGGVDWMALALAAALLLLSVVAGRSGIRQPWVFAIIGVALWGAMLASGVHATIAGVLLAFTIPARTRINEAEFLAWGSDALHDFDRAFEESPDSRSSMTRQVLSNERSQDALHTLEQLCEQAQPPLHRLEHGLHGIVAFGIMPLFALANAGVSLTGSEIGAAVSHSITIGIFFGLVLGKLAGITLFTLLVTRFGLATMPPELTRRHLVGAAALGGIGFTMALFVAELAFPQAPELLAIAKVGVLAASVTAGLLGWCILRTAKQYSRE
jgi:NhaA family Na+:H+ antiporter